MMSSEAQIAIEWAGARAGISEFTMQRFFIELIQQDYLLENVMTNQWRWLSVLFMRKIFLF
ncbi:hypothetical protein B1F79_04055 [Coxiella-like endosymbiont of Rhipicephalus sanguineus]|nr:hypothetical protein [Coxiella-like endosymbiont of Rhipicephalus sanguineus]